MDVSIPNTTAMTTINSLNSGFNLISNTYYIITILLLIIVSAFIYISIYNLSLLLQLYYFSNTDNTLTAQIYQCLTVIFTTLIIICIFFYIYRNITNHFKISH